MVTDDSKKVLELKEKKTLLRSIWEGELKSCGRDANLASGRWRPVSV